MLYVATKNGLVTVNPNDGWRVTGRFLDGMEVTAIVAWKGVALAGTTAGIYRGEENNPGWQEVNRGLTRRHVRWMAYHAETAFAGTEPAAVIRSVDGGLTWRECPEVAELRDRYHWSLPYSPEAGCVRGFAFNGSRAYAAVEVGGVLRSDDGGESWRLAQGSDGRPDFSRPPAPRVHPDVHSIYTHIASPDLVYAPTGGGFYRSADGGATWQLHYDCYVRAAWIDPEDPEHILLGPASGVDRGGRIEETWDGGSTWQDASEGLNTPWPGHMVERFAPVGETMAAVLSNGEVVARPLRRGAWRRVLEGLTGVNVLADSPTS